MGEMDMTFRHLLRGLPRPILRLAFPRRQLVPVGPLDPSVDRPRQLTADNLFRVRTGSGDVGVHVEIERAWRPEIPRRLFEYASGAVVTTSMPVWSVVVLLRSGGRPPQGTGVYRIPGGNGDAFVFRYQVVPLWRLDARRMRRLLGLEGAPFCVAMHGADEAFVRSLAEDVHADRSMAQRDRQSTIQLLYMVSAAILGSETARRLFHVEWLIQDPNVQELISEWENKGRSKGLQEGRSKGLQEGRSEGLQEGRSEGLQEGRSEGLQEGLSKGRTGEARSLLYKVLAARSFAVTQDVHDRIDGEADVARVEAWLEAAVTAATLGDVFRDG